MFLRRDILSIVTDEIPILIAVFEEVRRAARFVFAAIFSTLVDLYVVVTYTLLATTREISYPPPPPGIFLWSRKDTYCALLRTKNRKGDISIPNDMIHRGMTGGISLVGD